MKDKKDKKQIYNARIILLPDGSIKVSKAEVYRRINQHRGDWEVANSRELSRIINKGKIIIK